MSDWVRVADVESIGDEEMIGMKIRGKQIALYRVAGKYYATDDVCTHAYALLSDGFLEDCTVECPIHAARFDIRTGAALAAPATQKLKTYPVKIEYHGVWVNVS